MSAKAKTHKKQHYIPRSYLAAWCDPNAPVGHDPYVWIFRKDEKQGRKKAPANIFHETDMYTIRLEGGERDLTIEKTLSQLEGDFCTVRDRIIKSEPIGDVDRAILYVFMAVMNARTIAFREHQRENWERVLEVGRAMKEGYEKASPEQKKAMESAGKLSTISDEPAMKLSDVEEIVEAPLQSLLGPAIQTMAPLLSKLDLSILKSEDPIGFITSDHPCVWHDPEAYKRPPLYQAPALMYESIEIWLPLSPSHAIYLNRNGITGSVILVEGQLDYYNRLTHLMCREFFVVNSEYAKDIWSDPGEEPEDSWRKRHERGEV